MARREADSPICHWSVTSFALEDRQAINSDNWTMDSPLPFGAGEEEGWFFSCYLSVDNILLLACPGACCTLYKFQSLFLDLQY